MEDEEFKRGDELAIAGDMCALEYGWWANVWLHNQAAQSNADELSRAAFSYALTKLDERHGKYLSRAQITDRIRIGRAFPEDNYNEILEEIEAEFHEPYHPSFSQLRAAYIKDDRPRTMELIMWAVETDASPMEINARKMGTEPESAEGIARRNLIMWAGRFLERASDPACPLYKAAEKVIQVS